MLLYLGCLTHRLVVASTYGSLYLGTPLLLSIDESRPRLNSACWYRLPWNDFDDADMLH